MHHTVEEQQNEIKKLNVVVNGLNGEVKSWQLMTEKAKMEAKTANLALEAANSLENGRNRNVHNNSNGHSSGVVPMLKENGGDSPHLSDIESDADLDLEFEIDMDIGMEGLDLDKPLSDLD